MRNGLHVGFRLFRTTCGEELPVSEGAGHNGRRGKKVSVAPESEKGEQSAPRSGGPAGSPPPSSCRTPERGRTTTGTARLAKTQ